MKKWNVSWLFLLFVGLGFFAEQSALQAATAAPAVTLASAMKAYKPKYKKPPVPSTAKAYTVLQLMNLINTSNKKKTSTFIVMIDAQGAITNSPSSAAGSQSVARAGLQSTIESNMNTSVTLQQDPALIGVLAAGKRLDTKNKDKYQKIVLYFELGGYRFYINDPFPGKTVTVKKKRRSPADNIIKKWDFAQIADPAKLQ